MVKVGFGVDSGDVARGQTYAKLKFRADRLRAIGSG
jgi:hypothetical protein